ncbi:ATP-binding cassette domain-containing protein [Pelagibaculum spongiae]|uniref:ATP-binding cassette domain-containing protein n=1 Tax=Pelagibaculum spongiae TaxID=2080658 RepID=UPI0019D4D198|nr:ATP-binding cassette domain-containing protein [Pelagibaculum spongiae]
MLSEITPAVGLQLVGLGLKFNPEQPAVFENLNITFPAAKWSCLLGASGCGKTSLLRWIAGLLPKNCQYSGQLLTSDQQPLAGRLSYMAQQDLLLPWLNLLDNVCLHQKLSGKSSDKKQLLKKAKQILEQVGLIDHLEKFPAQLSGGMRQRAALARTLIRPASVVLMDEPFSALDAPTRFQLQNISAELLKDRTVLLITHDPQEALRLADQLLLMKNGNIESLSLPTTLPPEATKCRVSHQPTTTFAFANAKSGNT